MHEVIVNMLAKYDIKDESSTEGALKEIIQEITLVGLWRAKFFEHALFYGGTALRLLHKLDRFSEDLDFCLQQHQEGFQLSRFHQAVQLELESFGFGVSVSQKEKKIATSVQSAFIKLDTQLYDLSVEIPEYRLLRMKKRVLSVKFELDTSPPGIVRSDTYYLGQPIEFFVKTLPLSDLFAGKMHAALCRSWKNRVKGRDWFDFLWFVKQEVPLNLNYLESRLKQSGFFSQTETLTETVFRQLLVDKIKTLSINEVKADIRPFIQDVRRLDVWSLDFFEAMARRVRIMTHER